MAGKKVEFIVCLEDRTWCLDECQVPIDGETTSEELEEWWMETQLSRWAIPVVQVGVYSLRENEDG